MARMLTSHQNRLLKMPSLPAASPAISIAPKYVRINLHCAISKTRLRRGLRRAHGRDSSRNGEKLLRAIVHSRMRAVVRPKPLGMKIYWAGTMSFLP